MGEYDGFYGVSLRLTSRSHRALPQGINYPGRYALWASLRTQRPGPRHSSSFPLGVFWPGGRPHGLLSPRRPGRPERRRRVGKRSIASRGHQAKRNLFVLTSCPLSRFPGNRPGLSSTEKREMVDMEDEGRFLGGHKATAWWWRSSSRESVSGHKAMTFGHL